MRVLVDHQTKFIALMMGGPASYTDEHLKRVHAHLGIGSTAFGETVLDSRGRSKTTAWMPPMSASWPARSRADARSSSPSPETNKATAGSPDDSISYKELLQSLSSAVALVETDTWRILFENADLCR